MEGNLLRTKGMEGQREGGGVEGRFYDCAMGIRIVILRDVCVGEGIISGLVFANWDL